jgi:hypothetical protein
MPIENQNRAATSPGQSFPRQKPRFNFYDDRGNLLNLPPNPSGGLDGIYRTYLSGANTGNVMVPINKGENKYPPGFTPPEAYYISGSSSINQSTGLPVEMGNRLTNVSLTNNTSTNKIVRTYLSDNKFFFPVSEISSPYGQAKMTPGFTNPFFYIINKDLVGDIRSLSVEQLPLEFGNRPSNLNPNYNKNISQLAETTPPLKVFGNSREIPNFNSPKKIVGKKEVFDKFNDNERYTFVHGISDNRLPYVSSQNNMQDTYLASFVSTSDNEDPVMFGYDITIDYDHSPLFNGAIIDFINKITDGDDRSEIGNRKMIWVAFCKQFFKFFKSDFIKSKGSTISSSRNKTMIDKYDNFPGVDYDTNISGQQTGLSSSQFSGIVVDANSDFSEGKRNVKTYYLKKISGLEKLVEGDVSNNSDTIKSMVDYGKDVIKLTLNEDVSVNTGYLSVLYKALSWSRLNGRQVIPENLLRFDAKITITEIRNYNRVILANDSYSVYADNTTKYIYKLYDCQFLFDKVSHGDEIDMSNPSISDGYDISFNYKYSSMLFEKFSYSPNTTGSTFSNPTTLRTEIDNISGGFSDALLHSTNSQKLKMYDLVRKDTEGNSDPLGTELANVKYYIPQEDKWKVFSDSPQNILSQAKVNNRGRELLQNLEKSLRRAAIGEINRRILTQARLLNRTLDNIRNSIGLGRMSAPTNVYESDFLRNDVRNAFREFIGQSVRGFFDSNI